MMEAQTNLRRLRGCCHISLPELAAASGLSNQYISGAELGKIRATKRLETQLASALETIIRNRKKELLSLETALETCRGRLLEAEEGKSNDE